jgi:DNA-directed RNA polymerase
MDMPVNSLERYQLELEEEALGLGIERYREQARQDPSATSPGRRLLRSAVGRLVPVLEQYIKETLEAKVSRNLGCAYVVQEFEPDELALLTSTKCLQALADDNIPVQQLALDISEQLRSSKDHKALRDADPKLYKQLQGQLRKAPSAARRYIILRKYQDAARVVSIKWDAAERLRAGTKLIELFCQGTGLAKVETVDAPRKNGKPSTVTKLLPTAETKEWMDREHTAEALLCPRAFPMIVPPRDWSKPNDGGYLTEALRLTVVKQGNKNFLEDMNNNCDLSRVYAAINALQRTPWSINGAVYSVMAQAWHSGVELGGLPTSEETPLAEKPHDFDTNEEAMKQWKRAAAQIRQQNDELRGARSTARNALDMAKRMRQYERLYFVYTMDFRGRVYPASDHLSPQGNDVTRALQHFADGYPLGERGAFWLAVHGANCFGEVDKESFKRRVQWVHDNETKILDSANDPLHHTFWAGVGVDKPWQFLAFCREWSALRMWVNAERAECDFISRLPVALDGTCNGLQNYSMLMRDEVGGTATNLLPGDKPADIYQRVADKANAIIEAHLTSGNATERKQAQLWKGKVDRRLAKRPTMTTPYGSTKAGIEHQLLQTLQEIKRDIERDLLAGVEGKERFQAVLYLADVMRKAIDGTVEKASEAMKWLQDVAGIAAKEGLPFWWQAPSGLLVRQHYRKQNSTPVSCTIDNRRYTLTLTTEADDGLRPSTICDNACVGEWKSTLDKRKQKTATAANYIHCLDAAHLVRSVNYAKEKGVEAFAMVHDSYGTHAGNVEVLANELRRAFVDQYSENLLAKFREYIVSQIRSKKLRESVPEVPDFGNLDLSAVLRSDYFFS